MHQRPWKAQTRLCQRYRYMMAKGKLRQVVVTAIARELAGFVWSIACITTDPPAKSVAATMALEEVCPHVSIDRSRARPPAAESRRRRAGTREQPCRSGRRELDGMIVDDRPTG
jgi:hypothetical protein